MMRKCALITGATGYIGSNLARKLLANGWLVKIIVRPKANFELIAADLDTVVVYEHDGSASNMVDIVRDANPDVVFHLAALFLAEHKTENIDDLIDSNIRFSVQLVDAMARKGIKYLINTGTSWQHYRNAVYDPVNLYAATKQAFETLLSYYVEVCNLKVITLVLFDTYGPGDPRQKLIQLLWKIALTQKALQMSPGDQMIDLVHIDDVINAYILAFEEILKQNDGHKRYSISSGNALSLKNLVREFELATKMTLPIFWGGRPYRVREVMVPCNNLPKLPGWNPEKSFSESVLFTKPAQVMAG